MNFIKEYENIKFKMYDIKHYNNLMNYIIVLPKNNLILNVNQYLWVYEYKYLYFVFNLKMFKNNLKLLVRQYWYI
jgi:hypothetical protein